MNGPIRPDHDQHRQEADQEAPIGHHEDGRDLEDLGPDLVEGVDQIHGRILPVPPALGAFFGLPFLVVAPRPPFQLGRSISAGSPSLERAGDVDGAGPDADGRADRAGRGFPIDGDASRPLSSRPSSHADPAVRAPRSRAPWRRSRSSVTTRRVAVPSGAIDQPDVLDHREDDVVRGPAAAVADDDPGGDPLVAQTALRRPVEDQLDGRGGRDHAT